MQRLTKVGVLGKRLSCCQKADIFDSNAIDMLGLLNLDWYPLHIQYIQTV